MKNIINKFFILIYLSALVNINHLAAQQKSFSLKETPLLIFDKNQNFYKPNNFLDSAYLKGPKEEKIVRNILNVVTNAYENNRYFNFNPKLYLNNRDSIESFYLKIEGVDNMNKYDSVRYSFSYSLWNKDTIIIYNKDLFYNNYEYIDNIFSNFIMNQKFVNDKILKTKIIESNLILVEEKYHFHKDSFKFNLKFYIYLKSGLYQ